MNEVDFIKQILFEKHSISATIQCGLRDLKDPIKKTGSAVVARLNVFFDRSEKTCAVLEDLFKELNIGRT